MCNIVPILSPISTPYLIASDVLPIRRQVHLVLPTSAQGIVQSPSVGKPGRYLGVAGLYNIWKSQGAEKFYSMTFLMRPASKFVMEHGHHRQPFFIEERGFDSWMEPRVRDAQESLAILRKFAYERPFLYQLARQMAPSWKSRQKARLRRASVNAAKANIGYRTGSVDVRFT